MRSVPRCFAIAILMCLCSQINAQLGLRTKYNINTFPDWDSYIDVTTEGEITKIFPTTMEIGLDFRFKMKSLRIELLPDLSFGLRTETIVGFNRGSDFTYLTFNLNTQIYVFDLKGNTTNPTASNNGNAFRENFFLSVTPGLLLSRRVTTRGQALVGPYTQTQTNFRIGIGAGYDIGVDNLLTITPSIVYNWAPRLNFALFPLRNPDFEWDYKDDFHQFQFQFRFGFRIS